MAALNWAHAPLHPPGSLTGRWPEQRLADEAFRLRGGQLAKRVASMLLQRAPFLLGLGPRELGADLLHGLLVRHGLSQSGNEARLKSSANG